MNLYRMIAARMGAGEGNRRKLGRISHRLAVGSVTVSLFVMILATAVSGGFRKEIREKAAGFSGDMILAAPGIDIVRDAYPLPGNPSFLEPARQLGFIRAIQPVSYRAGILKTGEQIEGVLFKGIDSTYRTEFFEKHLIEGELPDYRGRLSDDILVSARLAASLGYRAGDKALAYFVGEEDVKVRRFRICGIYDARLEEVDKVLILADMRHIARLNGWRGGEVSGFEVLLKKSLDARMARQEEELSDLIFRYTGEEDPSVAVTTLRDRYYVLFDWLHLLDLNVVIILVLMMAVAGFNMVSGILIILFERVSQIGVLKALGMTDRGIVRIFLYKASFILFRGMLWGNGLALACCFVQWKFHPVSLNPANYFVESVPIAWNVPVFLLINAGAFVLILLLLLLPCKIISRINPAKSVSVK